MERGKADADTAARAPESAGGKRERAARRKPEALSTVAASAGGPARRCAGINRHGGGDGRALHRRSSEPR